MSAEDTLYLLDGFVPLNTWMFPLHHVESLKQMKLHEKDVLVCGYPKSGNIWLVTIVKALQSVENLERFAEEGCERPPSVIEDILQSEAIKNMSKPAVQFSHLCYNRLPESVTEGKNKVLYITRNPKDIQVSAFNYLNILKTNPEAPPMPAQWDVFFENSVMGNHYFSTKNLCAFNKDWLKHREESNVLFVEYENLKMDPLNTIRGIAEFLEIPVTENQLMKVASVTSFKTMRDNSKLDIKIYLQDESKGGRFIRKGEVGDWRNYFTQEQNALVDSIYDQFVADTGFKHKFQLDSEK